MADLFCFKDMLTDGGSNAAFVIWQRNGPAKRFQFRYAIAHHNWHACEFEHVSIIPIVSDRHYFALRDSAAPSPFGERGTL